MRILVVCKNNFLKKKIKNKFFFIHTKKDLTIKNLKLINPKIIFFPHWSWKIKKSIINNYLCIGFHATPLPYGRGGTPIQNMILKGFTKTKLCAFKIQEKFDTGPIYQKASISLSGSGDEILNRLYSRIYKMMIDLSNNLPKPKKQIGKTTYFKRRKPNQSIIKIKSDLIRLYNFIRMLDISEKNFPKAFLKIGKIKYEFSNAKKKGNAISANVLIKKFN